MRFASYEALVGEALLLLWGDDRQVMALEVCGYGNDSVTVLPPIANLCKWEGTRILDPPTT